MHPMKCSVCIDSGYSDRHVSTNQTFRKISLKYFTMKTAISTTLVSTVAHAVNLSRWSSDRVLLAIIINHGMFLSFVCFSMNSHMLPRISVHPAHVTSLSSSIIPAATKACQACPEVDKWPRVQK